MRFITITIFAVTSRLVALAIAKPIPNWAAGGIAIPLVRHPSFPNDNTSIGLDAVSAHGISVREKILSGLDNYEMNTGMMHPLAVKRSNSGSGLVTRGASLPLKIDHLNTWMAEISIGTPPKTFNVHLDTGSADMWVMQTGCLGIVSDHDLWDPHLSETSEYEGKLFELKYGDGTVVKGGLYTDNVTIAGFTADSQTFGSASSYTGVAENEINIHGVLGLAFPSASKFGASPLFQSLISHGAPINPTLSLKLAPSGAEMYIGGTNHMLYDGDIAYTPIQNTGLWQVSMDDVRVNGRIILENLPAVFDTGSSFIYGPWDRVAELYKGLGASVAPYDHDEDFSYYYLPCQSFPTVSLTFGGRSFEIPPEDLKLEPIKRGSPKCFSAIVGYRSLKRWEIGNTFLQGVYSVFDYSALRVGFAKLA